MEELLEINSTCVDCKSTEIEGVNMQLGVFLCGPCSVVHSKLLKMLVRSLSDNFLEEEISFLMSKGNKKTNDVLNRNLTPWTVSISTSNYE